MGRLVDTPSVGANAAKLRPGDTHIIPRKHSPDIMVHRTSRPYIEDLCDGLNAALERRDIEWAVGKSGEQLYLRSRGTEH